jgi:hypothetical protein
MGSRSQRRRLFIDYPVQGTLLIRAVVFWMVTIISQVLMVLFFAMMMSDSVADFNIRGQQLWWHLELVMLASALILPAILLDFLRLSHRWVGPVFRLRASLQALNRGEAVEPIAFREGDFWQELAVEFNRAADELKRLRSAEVATDDFVRVADANRTTTLAG